MKNDRAEIEWAPRVRLHKIREFYVREAQGICDDELIDDVGYGLYSRCESILEYTEAVRGSVKCMRCAKTGTTTIIERKTKKPVEFIKCPVCSWQVRWRVYVAEAKKTRGQLEAGHAIAAFQKYVKVFPKCRTPKEKILAIDRLIHEFHWELRGEGRFPEAMRTASVNLLQGTATQVLELLDELTYNRNTARELLETRDWWRSQKPIARRRGQKESGIGM